MTRRSLSFFAVLLSFFSLSPAAQFVSEPAYTLPADETRVGDIYFGGTTFRIEGRLDGSALAGAQSINISGPVTRNLFLAGQSIDVSGAVAGDVAAFCATLNVTGSVDGAVRTGAGTVYINGAVGQDVLAGCANLTSARVRKYAAMWSRAAGPSRSPARCAATSRRSPTKSHLRLDRRQRRRDRGRQADAQPDARVYGNLRYRSTKELDLATPTWSSATSSTSSSPLPRRSMTSGIEAAARHAPHLPPAVHDPLDNRGAGGRFPARGDLEARLNEGLNRSLAHWGRTIGFGAVGFLIGPMGILIAFALIVTIPAGLIAGAAYLVCLYLAKVLAGMFTGRLLFRIFGAPEVSLWWTAPVGIVIVFGLCAIPLAGWVVWLASMAVGFGVIAELLGMSRTA